MTPRESTGDGEPRGPKVCRLVPTSTTLLRADGLPSIPPPPDDLALTRQSQTLPQPAQPPSGEGVLPELPSFGQLSRHDNVEHKPAWREEPIPTMITMPSRPPFTFMPHLPALGNICAPLDALTPGGGGGAGGGCRLGSFASTRALHMADDRAPLC